MGACIWVKLLRSNQVYCFIKKVPLGKATVIRALHFGAGSLHLPFSLVQPVLCGLGAAERSQDEAQAGAGGAGGAGELRATAPRTAAAPLQCRPLALVLRSQSAARREAQALYQPVDRRIKVALALAIAKAAVEAVAHLGGVGAHQATAKHPRKSMYRARAHSNPFNDPIYDVPPHPDDMDWSEHFPERVKKGAEASTSGSGGGGGGDQVVRFADIGCGFGGLLIKLSPLYPDTLMVGMELRDKVAEYVRERIACLRHEHPGQYQNASVLRSNSMKFLPNYFRKGQLTKLFFLFPDPHFKACNHRRRIIQSSLLTEYAHLMAPGGWLYTITDVPELGEWMRSKLEAHPMFEALPEAEVESDPAAQLLAEATEEGQKVARNGGTTYRAVFRRKA
ncbi:MAG: putative methyltransferase-domain-containing protein [Monoraphidium minutum]|nr:MAG: putative methyltransferase-domain-containing protein [Monoraphidium minutum]